MAKITCSVCGTDKRVFSKTNYGKPLCRPHDTHFNKFGKFFPNDIYSRNEIIKYDNCYHIILRDKAMNEVGRATIDLEDYEKVYNYKWSLSNGYVRCVALNTSLHSLIFGEHDGDYIDHISRNRLDCRKSNLRSVSATVNGYNKGKQSNNTSGHVGVSWEKRKEKWESHIKLNRTKKFLGYFDDINDAVEARLKAEVEYFGEKINRENDIYTVFKPKKNK